MEAARALDGLPLCLFPSSATHAVRSGRKMGKIDRINIGMLFVVVVVSALIGSTTLFLQNAFVLRDAGPRALSSQSSL